MSPIFGRSSRKLWGFASEEGGHLREGHVPGYDEAELSVQVAFAVVRHLSKRIGDGSI